MTQSKSKYEAEARQLISSNKFFQLSANWCPDCVYSLSIWDKFKCRSKIKIFDIGNLSKDEQESWRSAFLTVSGSRNLPTIFVDGSVWGTETKLHELEGKGLLKQELTKIGLIA
ncbi:hypothetical protein NCAS_0J01250 [Naumovozyma castellii]|uniref:Uncharacterized protein n=1 Tax=Naumovozyma castellii TaxID=27288 RepID=G0VKR6_NAUCA|nr:hypothetical protein NCAS_0J01250 [Naumovozyma castellii CBS 4309]CCC72104.1 hypothetical protein NCAS_0J01250 [Naumovozyma castellii CBS 4309]